MTEEQFGRLVRRIEASAQRGYANYLRRTWLLGWCGVAFPFVSIVVCLAVVAVPIVLAPSDWRVLPAELLLLLSALAYLGGKAFLFRWPAPGGVRLESGDFPELFGLLERLRLAHGSRGPAAVYVDGSFNAAVAQQPRRGFFGKRREWLTVGLPLMDSLSPDQFTAVLAHEFGHLASGAGATSTQIYAMRLMMEKLAGNAGDEGNLLVRAVGPFYRRFVRYFDAYSCVAARSVEIDADRAAAAYVGNATFASALVAVSVGDRRIDRDFWEPLERELETTAAPPADVYERIAAVVARPLPDAPALLERALEVVSQSGDTHPSLAERLRALEVPPAVALAPLESGALRETGSAAAAYLGDGRKRISAELGSRWAAEHAATWTTARRECQSRRARLAALEARAGALTREEVRERVRLAYALERSDVESLARELLEADPSDAVAHFYIGTVLADRNDPAALPWLERAFAADADAVVPAANCAIGLLVKLGRMAEAERFADRSVARLVELERDRARRATCSPSETFVAHDLDGAALAAVARVLASYESIAAAWLARRTILSPVPAPAFALVIDRRRGKYEIDDAKFTAALRDELGDLGDFFVTTASGRDAAFRRALSHVAGAHVYAKG